MTLYRFPVVGAVIAVTVAAVVGRFPAPAPDREVARIRAHFDSALSELPARDAGTLTARQRVRRASAVETLQAYRDRGVFPHNYDFPGQAVPYFVDRKTGTLCAVAHLLASTGRRDIVDRVALADNNVWVAALARDTAFSAWLDDHGLTLAEAARIQVPYNSPSTPEVATMMTVAIVGPLALSGSIAMSAWNALGNSDGHRRVPTVLGITSGIASVGVGTLLMAVSDGSSAAAGVGLATAALGGTSIGLALRAIGKRNELFAAKRDGERKRAIESTLSPIVSMNGATGVSVSVRF